MASVLAAAHRLSFSVMAPGMSVAPVLAVLARQGLALGSPAVVSGRCPSAAAPYASAAAATAVAPAFDHPAAPTTAGAAHAAAAFPLGASPFLAKKPALSVISHPVYSSAYTESIVPRHRAPQELHERAGLAAVTAARWLFDRTTGYRADAPQPAELYLKRFVFLESVAAVPGLVAGALRHLRSLRLMRPDQGWINTLLQEAENERMHLLTFLELRKPGLGMRAVVLLAQGVFWNAYFLCYIVSPKTCHSFVGYLEEEAVRTYTHAIRDLRAGHLPQWQDLSAPELAKQYWKLPEGAKMIDVLLAVRADERAHEAVNHTYAHLKPGDKSPIAPHDHVFPQ